MKLRHGASLFAAMSLDRHADVIAYALYSLVGA
jgi:hypothetical protein